MWRDPDKDFVTCRWTSSSRAACRGTSFRSRTSPRNNTGPGTWLKGAGVPSKTRLGMDTLWLRYTILDTLSMYTGRLWWFKIKEVVESNRPQDYNWEETKVWILNNLIYLLTKLFRILQVHKCKHRIKFWFIFKNYFW